MRITYTPGKGTQDEQPQLVWEVQPEYLSSREARRIEKTSGMTLGEWVQQLRRGSVDAREAMLLHCLQQAHPRMDTVPSWRMCELEIEMSAAEWTEVRDSVAESRKPDHVKEQMLETLNTAIQQAYDYTPDTGDDLGKGPCPTMSGTDGTGDMP